MKIIIAGGRDFTDYALLKQKCGKILQRQTKIEIISGTARGADSLGEKYAKEMGYKVTRYFPNWKEHGKSAGIIRNIQMAENADACIVFWDGNSRGTKHMTGITKKPSAKIMKKFPLYFQKH
jgi:hypothetical protein